MKRHAAQCRGHRVCDCAARERRELSTGDCAERRFESLKQHECRDRSCVAQGQSVGEALVFLVAVCVERARFGGPRIGAYKRARHAAASA